MQMGETCIDDIYTLIATNRLYVDLRAAPLAEPERVRLFRDADIARACTLVGAQPTTVPSVRTEAYEQLARASPTDLREANRRYAIIHNPDGYGCRARRGTRPNDPPVAGALAHRGSDLWLRLRWAPAEVEPARQPRAKVAGSDSEPY